MNRDEFMELVYETFADEPDNVLANGIIEAADAYVEQEKAQLFKEGTTSDMISRQAAIDAVEKNACNTQRIMDAVNNLPPAQPEPTDIDAKEAVYNLAEKIGIHQLFALTVELRGEPIQPEPAIPLSWIDKYIEQLNCTPGIFAELRASIIEAMLSWWKKGESNE